MYCDAKEYNPSRDVVWRCQDYGLWDGTSW
jgi:hypothetical protein